MVIEKTKKLLARKLERSVLNERKKIVYVQIQNEEMARLYNGDVNLAAIKEVEDKLYYLREIIWDDHIDPHSWEIYMVRR